MVRIADIQEADLAPTPTAYEPLPAYLQPAPVVTAYEPLPANLRPPAPVQTGFEPLPAQLQPPAPPAPPAPLAPEVSAPAPFTPPAPMPTPPAVDSISVFRNSGIAAAPKFFQDKVGNFYRADGGGVRRMDFDNANREYAWGNEPVDLYQGGQPLLPNAAPPPPPPARANPTLVDKAVGLVTGQKYVIPDEPATAPARKRVNAEDLVPLADDPRAPWIREQEAAQRATLTRAAEQLDAKGPAPERGLLGGIGAGMVRGVGGAVKALGGYEEFLNASKGWTPQRSDLKDTGAAIQADAAASGSVDAGGAFQPGNWRWYTERGSEAVPTLLSQVGLLWATKGESAAAQFSAFAAPAVTEAVGASYNGAIERGADPATATGEATLNGVVALALQKFNLAPLLMNSTSKQFFQNAVLNRISQIGAKGLAEGGSNALASVAQAATEDVMRHTSENDPHAFDDWLRRYAGAGVQGFAAGATVGGLHAAADVRSGPPAEENRTTESAAIPAESDRDVRPAAAAAENRTPPEETPNEQLAQTAGPAASESASQPPVSDRPVQRPQVAVGAPGFQAEAPQPAAEVHGSRSPAAEAPAAAERPSPAVEPVVGTVSGPIAGEPPKTSPPPATVAGHGAPAHADVQESARVEEPKATQPAASDAAAGGGPRDAGGVARGPGGPSGERAAAARVDSEHAGAGDDLVSVRPASEPGGEAIPAPPVTDGAIDEKQLRRFDLKPEDLRRAKEFAGEGEAVSPAFAYGVKRGLTGESGIPLRGMGGAEAREALRGFYPAKKRSQLSAPQRAAAGQSASAGEGVTGGGKPPSPPSSEKPSGETPAGAAEQTKTKVSPNVVRSAAVLAAAKLLRTADPEMFNASPHTSEVPLRVSAKDLQAALDQVGRDWALDPAALEKYRAPVEKEVRRLLSVARRAGSFDAALAGLKDTPAAAGTVKQQIRGSTQSADPDKIIISAKDAIRQTMRLREQGRSEGLAEAAKLRNRVVDEAMKYLSPEERGPLMRGLAGIGNEAEMYSQLQKVYSAFERAQKRRAVEYVRDLIRGSDTKHLLPEFKKAMEALTGNVDDKTVSERTRARAEGLGDYVKTLSEAERAALPRDAQALLQRMGKEPLDSFSVEELHDLGDSIRAIVHQNRLKKALIVGKHLRDLGKAERQTVQEVMKAQRPLGLKGSEGSAKTLGDKSRLAKAVDWTDSPEVQAVSAGGEGGELHRHLYDELRKAENREHELNRADLLKVMGVVRKHGLTQADLIRWYDKTRTVALTDLPERPSRRPAGKGGFEVLGDAENASRKDVAEMGDVFSGGEEARKDAAAAAAGESIEQGTGGQATETARAVRSVGETNEPDAGTIPTNDETNGGNPETKPPARETAKGRSIELTGPEVASLWALSQNEGARLKLMDNRVLPERLRGQSSHNRTLQAADIEAITATMTPFEKDMARLALEIGNEKGPLIQEPYVRLNGYELPLEKNYLRLKTDQLQRNKAINEITDVLSPKWPEQAGMLRGRVPHSVPVLIPNLVELLLQSVKESNSFIAKAVPVRNARVLLGSKVVGEVLRSHVGQGFSLSMEKLLKDFTGADITPRRGYEKAAAVLARNFAVSTLGLRPTSVASNFLGAPLQLMTQMTRRESAAFVRKFINLKANTVDAGKYFEEQIAPHNPYLATRYDPQAEFHRQAVNAGGEAGQAGSMGLPTAKTVLGQKWRNFQEWSLSYMNTAERAAVVAAHRALTELNPEWTDAQVGEHLEKMVRRTQNSVSSIDMSAALRQAKESPVLGLGLMFTNQAAKLRDVVRLATLDYQRSGRTAADKAKLSAKLALVGASAAVVPALVRAAWGQVRGGFREEDAAKDKSVIQRALSAVADLVDVLHPWVGDFVRGIADLKHAGGENTVGARALSQLWLGGERILNAVEAKSTGKAGPAETAYKIIETLGRGIASYSGVPVDAPLSAAEGLGKAIAGRPVDFEIHQEATRLRAIGESDRTPEEKARLAALERYSGQVADVQKMALRGTIQQERADAEVSRILQAAKNFNAADHIKQEYAVTEREHQLRDEAALLRMRVEPGQDPRAALGREDAARLKVIESILEKVADARRKNVVANAHQGGSS